MVIRIRRNAIPLLAIALLLSIGLSGCGSSELTFTSEGGYPNLPSILEGIITDRWDTTEENGSKKENPTLLGDDLELVLTDSGSDERSTEWGGEVDEDYWGFQDYRLTVDNGIFNTFEQSHNKTVGNDLQGVKFSFEYLPSRVGDSQMVDNPSVLSVLPESPFDTYLSSRGLVLSEEDGEIPELIGNLESAETIDSINTAHLRAPGCKRLVGYQESDALELMSWLGFNESNLNITDARYIRGNLGDGLDETFSIMSSPDFSLDIDSNSVGKYQLPRFIGYGFELSATTKVANQDVYVTFMAMQRGFVEYENAFTDENGYLEPMDKVLDVCYYMMDSSIVVSAKFMEHPVPEADSAAYDEYSDILGYGEVSDQPFENMENYTFGINGDLSLKNLPTKIVEPYKEEAPNSSNTSASGSSTSASADSSDGVNTMVIDGQTVRVPDGGYIYPGSAVLPLDSSSFDGVSDVELWIGKNEILARNGRTFDNPELRKWFSAMPWYYPRYTPEEFSELPEPLSDIEEQNLKTIEAEEARRGSPYATNSF